MQLLENVFLFLSASDDPIAEFVGQLVGVMFGVALLLMPITALSIVILFLIKIFSDPQLSSSILVYVIIGILMILFTFILRITVGVDAFIDMFN